VGGDSLEEREATDETRLPAPGTVARMKTAPDRSPLIEQALVILALGVFK